MPAAIRGMKHVTMALGHRTSTPMTRSLFLVSTATSSSVTTMTSKAFRLRMNAFRPLGGTAAVAVAALMGAMKLREPKGNLREALLKQKFLFHGAGSANIGLMRLLSEEVGLFSSSS